MLRTCDSCGIGVDYYDMYFAFDKHNVVNVICDECAKHHKKEYTNIVSVNKIADMLPRNRIPEENMKTFNVTLYRNITLGQECNIDVKAKNIEDVKSMCEGMDSTEIDSWRDIELQEVNDFHVTHINGEIV